MSKHKLVFITVLAAIMFVPLFIFRQIWVLDFWWWMSANLLIVISLSIFLNPEYLQYLKKDFSQALVRKVSIGAISAALLYMLFYVGNYLSRSWFDFAGDGIQHVYDFKGNAEAMRIGLLMLCVIGPGEELFWRGVLQRQFSGKFGKFGGFILAAIVYTGVHVFTGNVMLILAALVAGLFWGWMYMRFNSMVMNIVSHTLWDISVFILFPFN